MKTSKAPATRYYVTTNVQVDYMSHQPTWFGARLYIDGSYLLARAYKPPTRRMLHTMTVQEQDDLHRVAAQQIIAEAFPFGNATVGSVSGDRAVMVPEHRRFEVEVTPE